MQTKSSYRALKWTLFMGLAATLASACVVSTGDGDDKDVTVEGGDGGTNNTSGTQNTGGTKAGNSTGGTSAGTGTGGTGGSGTAGSAGEAGSDADPDYPGVCDSSLKEPSVINAAACDEDATDNACGACLKAKCCDPFKACYGKEPTSACGYGPSPADDLGQFDCIVACYKRENDGVKEESAILEGCQTECLNQCDATDDFINDDTLDLMICALNGADGEMTGDDDCHDACFPPPM